MYRIRKIVEFDGFTKYKVQYQRHLFCFFGPKIWKDAVCWDAYGFKVPYFMSYKAARDFITLRKGL